MKSTTLLVSILVSVTLVSPPSPSQPASAPDRNSPAVLVAGPVPAPSKETCGSSEARARFLEMEPEFERYREIKLELPMAILSKRLQEKTGLRAELQKRYEALLRCTDANWVVAALVRIGQLSENLAEVLRQTPCPNGLTPEQVEIYRDALQKQAQPLVEKAAATYQKAVERAKEATLPPSNKWLVLAGERLEAMKALPKPATE